MLVITLQYAVSVLPHRLSSIFYFLTCDFLTVKLYQTNHQLVKIF